MLVAAFENVLKKVSDEVREEARSVLEDGFRQAQEVLKSAEVDSSAEVLRIKSSTDRQAETLRRKVVGTAELEARSISMHLVEEAVDQAFKTALEKLGEIGSSPDYRKVLKALLSEAIDLVGGKELIVEANARDLGLLKKMSGEAMQAKKVRIKLNSKPIDSVGGVVVKTSDGSIIYNNTLEARLDRLKPILRKRIVNLIAKERVKL